MGINRVEAADDPRLADFRDVAAPDRLSQRGLFVAEGRLVVRRLIEGGKFPVHALLLTEPAHRALADLIAPRPELPVWVVPQAVMNGVTGFNFHRGCLALARRPAARDWRQIVLATDPRPSPALVMLERVSDADNVGAIFRNAAAFAARAVLLHSACADPLYRKAIRTSMAAALDVPFARVDDWLGALRELTADGWATIAMTPALEAPSLHEVAATLGGHSVVIVVGHEGEGLTPAAIDACSHCARIPMAEGVDSVNVAVATAIALYQVGTRAL